MGAIARCFLQLQIPGAGGNDLYRYKLQLYLFILSFISLRSITIHARDRVPHFLPSPYSSPRLLTNFQSPHPACACHNHSSTYTSKPTSSRTSQLSFQYQNTKPTMCRITTTKYHCPDCKKLLPSSDQELTVCHVVEEHVGSADDRFVSCQEYGQTVSSHTKRESGVQRCGRCMRQGKGGEEVMKIG